MCGIIGVLGKDIPKQQDVIEARDTMSYRGPDDAGIYYDSKECIALGHRRLSIIDLSDAGHQPFFSNDERFVLVFNGEIYNYLEIKDELKKYYNFKTKTDSEVLLAAYMKWGEACLEKFNGMFAFAIWDRKEKKLFLARDRFGIKPLYYYTDEKNIYFSSEIKGIIHFNEVPRILNIKGVSDYLSYRYVLGKDTLFEGIYSVLPGHYAVVEVGSPVKQQCYWTLPVVSEKKDLGEQEVLEKTTALLTDSVRLRLRSDVPTGAYLSGGLDSSVLVGLMSSLSHSPIKTFSTGFSEDGFNELAYAKVVSDHFETDHHEFLLDGKDYFSSLRKVIMFKDYPLLSPNEVPWYILSTKLKKDITVVLSGGGADELFGGYGRIFRSGYDLERMSQLDQFSEEEKEILVRNLKKKYGVSSFKSPIDHFLSQYPYMKRPQKEKLLNQEVFDSEEDLLNKKYFEEFFSKLNMLSPTDQYLYVFQNVHLLGTLNHLDNVTMPTSVEARVPFVDHHLVEYVSSLPLKYKMAWKSNEDSQKAALLNSNDISEIHDIPKYILRKIGSQFLPEEIIHRKKLGFPVPLNSWFDGKFKKIARDMLLSPDAKSRDLYDEHALSDLLNTNDISLTRNYGLHIWMLMNMEIWLQEYNVHV